MTFFLVAYATWYVASLLITIPMWWRALYNDRSKFIKGNEGDLSGYVFFLIALFVPFIREVIICFFGAFLIYEAFAGLIVKTLERLN